MNISGREYMDMMDPDYLEEESGKAAIRPALAVGAFASCAAAVGLIGAAASRLFGMKRGELFRVS